jgi:dolichol-phosphate mannosyltransferase
LELLVKGRYASIREVPIFFLERRIGASKMTMRVQVDYLLHLAALYAYRLSNPRRWPRASED